MGEKQVREAIVSELKRQGEVRPDQLKVVVGDDRMIINGVVELEELVMAVVGTVAGGP